MGHANLSNISRFFVKRLFAKGTLSIGECTAALEKAGEQIHASEGSYSEPYMLSTMLAEVIHYMYHYKGAPVVELKRSDYVQYPIVVPVLDTPEKERLMQQWLDQGEGEWDEPEYSAFDQIGWRFGKGWRKRYPEIPILAEFTN